MGAAAAAAGASDHGRTACRLAVVAVSPAGFRRRKSWQTPRPTSRWPAMLFRVLGPLEVEVGTERITIPGERPRALLVALLLQPHGVLPSARLVDLLWPDQPLEDPANALHQVVRRLRSSLGELGQLVRSRAPGYQLAV